MTPTDEFAVPETIACPCGNGDAERRKTPMIERANADGGKVKRQYVWHYRHQGCPIGGEVVTVDGLVKSRQGPLFRAGSARQAAMQDAQVAVATDGGEPEGTEGVFVR